MSIAAHLAEPAPYRFRDKDYLVHPWTYEVQGKFERYLERQAIDGYQRVSNLLPAEESERALANVMRDIASGQYAFGSPTAQKALDVPRNVRYMFFLCLKKNHPEVTAELVDEMFREDYPGMISAMNQANTDPNRRRPADAPSPQAKSSSSDTEGAADRPAAGA